MLQAWLPSYIHSNKRNKQHVYLWIIVKYLNHHPPLTNKVRRYRTVYLWQPKLKWFHFQCYFDFFSNCPLLIGQTLQDKYKFKVVTGIKLHTKAWIFKKNGIAKQNIFNLSKHYLKFLPDHTRPRLVLN